MAAALTVFLAACGTAYTLPSDAAGQPRIELQSDPTVSYDATTGKTTVALEFLVRDASGASVDPATTTVRRYVDGVVDTEAVSATQDTRLSSNLRLGVVLDASYSMMQSQAFDLMKTAAYNMLESIRGRFSSAGSFTPVLSYFEDAYVCTAAASADDSAVLAIPTPQQGDATRLYAATAQMVGALKQAYDALPTPAQTNHFALVVFTDGYDNYSYFATNTSQFPTTTSGSFTCSGTPTTGLQDVVNQLQSFPQLKVYVIGLGKLIHTSELTPIATAGNGRLVTNPDPSQVSSLFGEITREFTTIRRDAITLPLPAGDHEYIEEVVVNGVPARVTFRFHTGDASAGVLPGSIKAG